MSICSIHILYFQLEYPGWDFTLIHSPIWVLLLFKFPVGKFLINYPSWVVLTLISQLGILPLNYLVGHSFIYISWLGIFSFILPGWAFSHLYFPVGSQLLSQEEIHLSCLDFFPHSISFLGFGELE